MSRNAVDAEIGLIQERVIRKWIRNESALICVRCGRAYIPSRSSDSDLCAMCYPARNVEFGDGSVRRPECEFCGGEIRGRREGARFCKDSCKTMYSRRKRNGDSTNARERALRAEDGQDIGSPLIRKQERAEGGSAA